MTTTERSASSDAESRASVRRILEWWERGCCPRCGGKISVNAKFDHGKWRPKNGLRPYEYCEKCEFRHYIDEDDRLPVVLYLYSIKESLDGCRPPKTADTVEEDEYDLPMRVLPERTMQELFAKKYVAIAKRKIIAVGDTIDEIREETKLYRENGVGCQVRYIDRDIHLFGRFVG